MSSFTISDIIRYFSHDIINYIYKIDNDTKGNIKYIDNLSEDHNKYYTFAVNIYNLNNRTKEIIKYNIEDFKDKIKVLHDNIDSIYKIKIDEISFSDDSILIVIDLYTKSDEEFDNEDITFTDLPLEMFTHHMMNDMNIKDLISLCSTSMNIQNYCKDYIYPDILKKSYIYDYWKQTDNDIKSEVNIEKLLLELDDNKIEDC